MRNRRSRCLTLILTITCMGLFGPVWGQSTTASPDQDDAAARAHLYYIAHDGRHLKAETVPVKAGAEPAQQGRDIVNALCKDPETGLGPLFTAPIEVRSFFIDDDGIAYVDFPAALRHAQPGGITHEQLTVYAIVNALVLNIPQISAVKFLIDGQEAETFAGHIDIARPLTANLMLIR